MRVSIDRWHALAPRWRGAMWLACSLALLLGWLLFSYRPVQQQLATLEQQWQRDAISHAALWSSTRMLYPPPETGGTRSLPPFTPLAFNANGLRLVRWQPAKSGGELGVAAAWAHIPALFSSLAQRDVAVVHFSVEPVQQALQVVLQLERRNAG